MTWRNVFCPDGIRKLQFGETDAPISWYLRNDELYYITYCGNKKSALKNS